MRTKLYLVLLLPALSACDGVDAGQLADDPGPPVLTKLLIQDELPTGGRKAATDLLDRSQPTPCSDREPCETGDKYSHPTCDPATMLCLHPLNPSVTPPAIGIPSTQGGNQIRLVFNKQLDPAMEVQTNDPLTGLVSGYALVDPSIIGIYDAQDQEMRALKYWDSTGAQAITSDVFLNPFGPALVIKQKTPLLPLTAYSIRIKADHIKDQKGQALVKDGNGDPIAARYDFVTEGFHVSGGALFIDKFEGIIDVKDALVLKVTARFDASTLKATVMRNGNVVETVAAPEFGTDPKGCFAVASNPQQINVFRVSGLDRADWEPGDYTISIDVVSIDRPNALFSKDPFSKIPYHDVPFSAKPDVDADKSFLAEQLLLPWECAASQPADMFGFDIAKPQDLSVVDDMSIPPMDMSMPDMGAPPDMLSLPDAPVD